MIRSVLIDKQIFDTGVLDMQWSILPQIREKLVFRKRRDIAKTVRNKLHRTYSKTGVESGLPMSKDYGMFTATFIRMYAPEKRYLVNMKYCFDRGVGSKESILNILSHKLPHEYVKHSETVNGKKIEYETLILNPYRPEDSIEILSKRPNLVRRVYNELKKFMHKELAYRIRYGETLDGQDRALAIILSRLDACDYDMMAIPTHDRTFHDREYSFKITDWYDVLNVFVGNNYFYKTRGDGSRKGANVITLPEERRYPKTYDEANYIPSLLVPDMKIFALFRKHQGKIAREATKRAKKELKKQNKLNERVFIGGFWRKIPVEFVNEDLDEKVQVKVDRLGKAPGYVCRRSVDEFASHLNDLGMCFPYGTDTAIAQKEISAFYNKVEEIAKRTNFNYRAVIHVITREFRNVCSNMRYCRGAFKWCVQYIMFGQTENDIMNDQLGIASRIDRMFNTVFNKILTAKVGF